MLASLRLDSSRRRKLCFFSSTFKLLWVDGYQAFSEKLGFGNFVGSLVEPFGAEGNRFMTKTVLSNTTPRGMEALYIVARRCSTMCRCWRSARPFCSGVGGTRFLVKNSRESTIHSVFASGISLRVGSPISLGNGHSPQVLMRQDLSLLKRCLKIERLWAKYTCQTNSWPESVICCLSFNGSEITLSPFSKEEILHFLFLPLGWFLIKVSCVWVSFQQPLFTSSFLPLSRVPPFHISSQVEPLAHIWVSIPEWSCSSAFLSITSMLASNKIVFTDTGITVLINIPTSQILSKGLGYILPMILHISFASCWPSRNNLFFSILFQQPSCFKPEFVWGKSSIFPFYQ